MSISSIQQAPGFNQQQYDSLIQEARTLRADAGRVDQLLLDAVNGGKSFDQALALVGTELPKLSPPNALALAQLAGWTTIPSPGALIMSLTVEYAAEQRQQNRELAWAQTEAVVKSMKDEAGEMREAARMQLILGCISGGLTAAVGLAQGIASGIAMKTGADASKLGAYNNIITGVGTFAGGASKILDSTSQYVGAMNQARMKEMEAEQEMMRALRDSTKELNEALRDLIQKSLAAQNDIQSNTNQARTRILA